MTLQTIENRQKIITALTAENAGNILELFTYTPYHKLGYRVLSESMRMRNIQLQSFVIAIPPQPFPVFPLEASESETQLELLKLEWQNPRYHCNLWIKNEFYDWIRLGIASIQNASPAPYREYVFPDQQLGDNAMLGMQIQNVGWGLLQGQDRVNITADLHKTITLQKVSEGIKRDTMINDTTPTLVLESNAGRIGFTVFNPSSTDVFLDLTSDVSLTSFLVKIPPQGYWESNFTITDQVFMILSSGSSTILIREFIG